MDLLRGARARQFPAHDAWWQTATKSSTTSTTRVATSATSTPTMGRCQTTVCSECTTTPRLPAITRARDPDPDTPWTLSQTFGRGSYHADEWHIDTRTPCRPYTFEKSGTDIHYTRRLITAKKANRHLTMQAHACAPPATQYKPTALPQQDNDVATTIPTTSGDHTTPPRTAQRAHHAPIAGQDDNDRADDPTTRYATTMAARVLDEPFARGALPPRGVSTGQGWSCMVTDNATHLNTPRHAGTTPTSAIWRMLYRCSAHRPADTTQFTHDAGRCTSCATAATRSARPTTQHVPPHAHHEVHAASPGERDDTAPLALRNRRTPASIT